MNNVQTNLYLDSKKPVIVALTKILKPLVRLLLDLGFGFRDFNEIAKQVYVEVATETYGIRGRKTNMSRVAIFTGLTRREVARLRKVLDSDEAMSTTPNTVASRVLADWHQIEGYVDAQAKPATIPLSGDYSLQTLVDTHRGDIPTTAVITELQRVGAIEINNQKARVVSRHYSSTSVDAHALERFGKVVSDLTRTVTHNLQTTSSNRKHFEKQAYQVSIPTEHVDEFRTFLDRRASDLLQDVNSWLADHTQGNNRKTMSLGAGVYAIVAQDSEKPGKR